MLPVLSAAVLPATPVQTDSLLPTSDSNSNVMNSNVQSVATFATVGGVTNDVVVSNLAARYLLPHEKVRKLSKVPTHLEVLSITNDLRKNGCPHMFVDVVPLDVEQSLVNSCKGSIALREQFATRAKIGSHGLPRDSAKNSSRQYLMSPSIHLWVRHRFSSKSHRSITDLI